MKLKSKAMETAEALAVWFLKLPGVTDVFLFGSVAMWGEGDDMDFIIVLSDPGVALAFLQKIFLAWKRREEERKKFAQPGTEGEYLALKVLRNATAFEYLGLNVNGRHAEYNELCWHGMFHLWNSLCCLHQWSSAARLEEKYFRPADLFLMPADWQTSDAVKNLLPAWSAKRPFGEENFLDVVRWQARWFNSFVGTFDGHVPFSSKKLEKRFTELQRREHISWTFRHSPSRW